jgi:hypothetical protein
VDQKSTSGCFLTMKFAMVSKCSRKQNSVALSTLEAKVYNSECANKCGFTKLLTDLLDHEMDPMMITKSHE